MSIMLGDRAAGLYLGDVLLTGYGYAAAPALISEKGYVGYFSVGSPSTYLTDGFTIEACCMLTDTSVAARQYQRLGEIELSSSGLATLALSNDQLEFELFGTWKHASTTDLTLSRDVMHTVAMVVDPEVNAAIYVDGVLLRYYTAVSAMKTNRVADIYSNRGEISNRSFLGTSYANRFYLRPLTEAEVVANHQLDVSRFG